MADLVYSLGDGGLVAALVEEVGQLEAHFEETQEQLVGGVRVVFHAELDPHHVTQGRYVPEVHPDPALGRWLGQGVLELLLLGAGQLGGVLVSGVPGGHRVQPGALSAAEPAAHRPVAAVDHLNDNTYVDTTRGIQNGLGL